MQLSKPRVIIVGGGFGGLATAKALKNTNVDVILIDKNNHHLFQPLLYQVATSALSPGDIAMPIRTELRKYSNVQVIMNEVISIDTQSQKVVLNDGELSFDYLVLAPGSRHSYFAHPEWEEFAPGLKDLSDALTIRENILLAFEKAERNYNSPDSEKYKTFVIVGGGPTGVEIAGTLSEIAKNTMLKDYPLLNYDDIKIHLIEGGDRLLRSFTDNQSDYTKVVLEKLGVKVHLNTNVIDLNKDGVQTNSEFINAATIIWAAGNQASPLLKTLNTELDKIGRVIVNKDLSIKNHPNIFVIGDAALMLDKNGNQIPGVAQGAIQGGKYVASIIKKRKNQETLKEFSYYDKGNMATIGRAKAIAIINNIKLQGFIAWLLWGLIHIMFLIDFRNRLRVMIEWFWFYLSYKPGARIIYRNKSNFK